MKTDLTVFAFSIRAWVTVAVVCIAAAAVAGTWYGWANLLLTEDQSRFWDMVLKAVGGFAAIAGALVTIRKFLDERREAASKLVVEREEANRVARIEARRPFEEKRQAVYYELLSATASICSRGEADPARIAAEERFWELYWGPIPMVCDDAVGVAVNHFEEALAEKRHDIENLRNCSMDLARACSRSLGFEAAKMRTLGRTLLRSRTGDEASITSISDRADDEAER